jgi:hypothetical protein
MTETIHTEQFEGHTIEVTHHEARAYGENNRSFSSEHVQLTTDGQSYQGYKIVVAGYDWDHDGGYTAHAPADAATVAKAVAKLVKKAKFDLTREAMLNELLPTLRDNCGAWTNDQCNQLVDAGRFVPADPDQLVVGSVIVAWGRGRMRQGVVTKVTATKVQGYYVTPSNPTFPTAYSVAKAKVLVPA